MKVRKFFIIGLGLLSFLTFGCKKFLDVNFSPSLPQEVTAELYLSPIIYHMANGYAQDQRIINKLTQAMLGSSTDRASYIWEQHSYPGGVSDVGGVMWRMVYYNHGVNLENMINDAIKNQKYEFAAIGYAIKAWDFQILTDYHGPIVIEDLYNPNRLIYDYNDQPDVYKRVQTLCDTALYYLSLKSPIDQTALVQKYDFLYAGNMDRWKKFIHGIKALGYSRYINKPDFVSNYADSVIKYASISFETLADDASVKFTATKVDNSNVYGSDLAYLSSTYYNKPGLPIVNYLTGGVRGEPVEEAKESMDPRLSRMLKFYGTDSLYIGATPNGQAANTNLPTVGNHYLFKNKADFPLFTYHQLQFIKAEVAFKMGDKDMAFESYRNGIIGHMNFVNKYSAVTDEAIFQLPAPITGDEITAYLDTTEVAQSPAELTLADIMGQKYISLWGWGGYDIWTDMRKYKYDTTIFRQFIPLSGSQLVHGDYCYRIRPRFNSEYMWNLEGLEKFGGLEANYVIQPVWFVLDNY